MTARLGDDHALLIDAAREAGAIAMNFFGKPVETWEKSPGQPVSAADIAVNRRLAERLRGARPDYGWLSEEDADADKRFATPAQWVVDPIDGTRAFLKQIPEFAVCAALVEDGEPVAGVVYNPAAEELYEATRGGGARLNDRPIAASGETDLARAHYLASRRTLEKQNWPRPAANRSPCSE